MESQKLALSCADDFIASVVVTAAENPQFDETLIMSDENFANELQLQEVIISSLIALPPPRRTSGGGESSKTVAEGGGGGPSQSLCEICAEKKDADAFFPPRSCAHAFCKDCISRYVSIKVEKRTIAAAVAAGIACPGAGCGGALEIAACREVVPREIAGMWDEQLCEAAVAEEERVYCPYRNCSALLVNDGGGGVEIREAECPFCRRLFCARCGVPWHAGIDCEGFSKLAKDEREREDLMVHDLAKKNKWKRCSNCNFFVEKNDGCLHITCRFQSFINLSLSPLIICSNL